MGLPLPPPLPTPPPLRSDPPPSSLFPRPVGGPTSRRDIGAISRAERTLRLQFLCCRFVEESVDRD